MSHLEHFQKKIDALQAQGCYRHFRAGVSSLPVIHVDGRQMLNLASNDYLGLACSTALREEFFDVTPMVERVMSSSSSRLLTGNFAAYERLEQTLSEAFGRSALLFNSGYHMNIGILPAVADAKTIILADKLVHASILDGIRLCSANYIRYRHNDLAQLEHLLQKYQEEPTIERILVVTESIFSMDGDETDLKTLVNLKQQFPKVLLYIDDAHAIGVRGDTGLGCAEQYQVMPHIDFLVGTFGKAMASVGGYLICASVIREFLINTMRPLIFSTAQPPISIAWTEFVFNKMRTMNQTRQNLRDIAHVVKQGVEARGYRCPSSSHIVPVIIGDADRSVRQAEILQEAGFYVLPVRPPTVPRNTSRLRLCLNPFIQKSAIEQMLFFLPKLN